MKKILLIILSLTFAVSCSDNNESETKFFKTYREILVAREMYQDSSEANLKVEQIIQENGYTQQSFRQTFFELAEDKNRFTKMIDSVRNSILKDSVAFK